MYYRGEISAVDRVLDSPIGPMHPSLIRRVGVLSLSGAFTTAMPKRMEVMLAVELANEAGDVGDRQFR